MYDNKNAMPPISIIDQKENQTISIILLPIAFLLAVWLRISTKINTSWDRLAPILFCCAIFWLILSVVYMILSHKKLIAHKTAFFVWCISIVLIVSVFFSGNEDHMQMQWFNAFFGVPIALVIAVQLANFQPKESGKQNLFLSCFAGFFSLWFTAMDKITIPLHFAFGNKKGKHSTLFRILIGLVIAIPIAIIIVYFLMKADVNFANFVNSIIYFISTRINLFSVITTCIFLILATLFIYSFLWNACCGRVSLERKIKSPKKYNLVTMATIVSLFLLIYLLFCVVRLRHGRSLPTGFTYSSYARSGFIELLIICVINLSIFSFMRKHTARQCIMIILLSFLLIFTFLIAFFSLFRIMMYVSEYQRFTFLRTIAMWFTIYVIIAIITCMVSLWKPAVHAGHILSLTFLIWYTILSVGYLPFMHYFGI